jgi:uncharacterized membrane protein YcaP (DUF421 family)
MFKSEPTLLVHHGQMLHGRLKEQRVSMREIETALRDAGFAQVGQVEAVILETDGTFSVIGSTEGPRDVLSQANLSR